MNNLPKVVAQQRRGRASNPRLLDRKADALPLSHRATLVLVTKIIFCWIKAAYDKHVFILFLTCFQINCSPVRHFDHDRV